MFIDSVDEFDALHEIRQVVVAAKFAPAPGGTLSKLEHHCQTGFRAAVAFGLAVSQADRGERAFDRIRRMNVAPVVGRKVEKRQQHVAIF